MKYLRKYKLFEDVDNFNKFVSSLHYWNINFDYNYITVSVLEGKIIADISINDSKTEMLIVVEGEGQYEFYKFYHEEDCCEHVYLSDVIGDLDDLIGEVVTQSEEASRKATYKESSESGTWTFYKLASRKGYVTLRWLGESNGYYSESMSFCKSSDTIDTHEELQKLLGKKKPT